MKSALPRIADVKAFAANVSSIANEVFGGRSSKSVEHRPSKISQREVIDHFERYEPEEMALVIRENPLWAAAEVLGLSRSELEQSSGVWDRFRKWQDEHNRLTENQIALAVCQIAAEQPNGVVSFSRLKREIPKRLIFSSADRAQSLARPNEQRWEQLIRNIKSHSSVPGNYIHEGYLEHVPRIGYRVTPLGRRRAERRAP